MSLATSATSKETVLALVRQLPDEATFDEIMERIYLRVRIEESLRELDEGSGVPHEEVKKRLSQWLE